jgi:hypothetical protein
MRDNSTAMSIRPIFVLGSPRSGTTMIGNYLGTAESVLNAGEYRGLYLAHAALPLQLGATSRLVGVTPAEWQPYQALYIQEVQDHAAEFIVRVAERAGKSAFCDSGPRNVFICSLLAEMFPNALFVLTLRHYTGTIQSLLRLGSIQLMPAFEPTIDYASATAVAAAAVWARHYSASFELPNDRTVLFGYDSFCADPEPVLQRFKVDLAAAGFPVEELDDSSFAESHATTPGKPRATAARRKRGGVRLTPLPSFDASAWSPRDELDVNAAVGPIDSLLRSFFPRDYASPAGYSGSDALLAEAQRSTHSRPRSSSASPRRTDTTRSTSSKMASRRRV